MKNFSKWQVLLIAIIAIIFLGTAAIYYYYTETKDIRKEKYEYLHAVAMLKIDQITKWRNERLSEAEFFPTVGRFIKSTVLLSENPNDEEAKNFLMQTLNPIKQRHHYKNLLITDLKNSVLFSIDPDEKNLDSATIAYSSNSIELDSVMFTDIYYCNSHFKIHLDILSPIKDNNGKIIGTFILRFDPKDFLFPLIQKWPTPSKTAENVIFKKELGQIKFISDLKYKKNSAMNLVLPLTKTEYIAVRGALGETGIVEGKDYRGVEVLADLNKIPGTDWYLVSKVDKDEIYSDLFYRARAISLLTVVSFLFVITMAMYLIRNKQTLTYKNLFIKEKELSEAREEFKTTLYSIGDAVITTDSKGFVKYMNGVAEQLTCWKESEASGKKLNDVFKIVNEDTNIDVENPVTRVLKNGSVVGLANHTMLVRKDGTQIPIADSGSPIKDSDGKITGVVLVFRDQSEERKKEKTLLESEEKYRKMTLSSPMGMHFYELKNNDDLVLIDSNPAADEILGIDHSMLLGKTIQQAFPPLATTEIPQRYREVASSGIFWNTDQITYKDNKIEGAYEVRAYQIQPNNMVAVFMDITERKRLEASQKASEEKYRMLLDFASDSFFQGDKDGNFIYVNNKAIDLTGYSKEELLKMNMKDLFSKEILESTPLRYDRLLAGDTIKSERVIVRKDQQPLFVEMTSKQMPDGTYQSFIRDLSEYKKTKKEYEAAEERFRLAFTTSPDSININRLSDGRYVTINNGFTKMTGYTEADVIGKTSAEINIWADIKYRHELVEMLKTTNIVDNFEAKFRMKDGSIKDGLMSASVIELNGEKHIISITRDITDRKKADEILRLSETNLKNSQRVAKIGHYDLNITTGVWTSSEMLDVIFGIEETYNHDVDGWIKLLHPDDKEMMTNHFYNDVIKNKNEFNKVYRIVSINNNEVKWVYGLGKLEMDKDNNLVRMFGTIQDITEIKKAEEEILKTKVHYQKLIENAPDGIVQITIDGEFKYVSTSAKRIFGYPIHERVYSKPNELTHPEDLPKVLKVLSELIKNPKLIPTIEYRFRNYDGDYLWIESTFTNLLNEPSVEAIVINFRDINFRKTAEAKLRSLSQAVEQSPVIIVMTDLTGVIEYVNPKFTEVTGYKIDEVKGKNPRILSSGQKTSEDYSEMWNAILSGKEWQGEFHNKKKNGELYWESATISPITDANNNITHFVALKEDITEKKKILEQLSDSEEEFRSIWESSVDAMRLVDENGVIINVNNSYCNLFGLKKEELMGNLFNVSYTITEKDTTLRGFKERFKTGTIIKKFETEIQLKSGKIIWVELTNSFIQFEDKASMLLSIIRDITDRKLLITELTDAKNKAEEMNKVKSYFFANMSHELRTPFVGILGFAEILKDTLQNSDEREYAEQILKSSKRLTDTLNKILNVTRLEFDKIDLKYKEINVTDLLKSIENFYQPSAKLNNTTITTKIENESIFIRSDLKLLEDILNNLVSNAIKFTHDGNIKLSVKKIFSNNKHHISIKVEDNGIGIPKEKQSLVWQEFRQASEGFNRSFEGTGLGLTITKKYVEILGGEISLESKEKIGTVFTILLPEDNDKISELETEVKISNPRKTDSEKPKTRKDKILYVEDDMVALQFINIILKSTYDVETVFKAKAALDLAEKEKYDVLLVDINLGSGMDGVELMQKIRQIDYYKNIPIVAVTAYAAQSDKKEFLDKGFTHYISKPFTKKELISLLQEVLSN